MSRFPVVFGALATVALIAAAPVSTASAQVPYDLLLINQQQPSNNIATAQTKDDNSKLRSAYARARKVTPAH